MNPPIHQLKKWIAALDSGRYKQGKWEMQGSKCFCPLGLACKVLIPHNKQYINRGRLIGSHPREQMHAPKWLKDINADFAGKTGRSIMGLNDTYGYTFSEIATLLELVYIYKMLD